ncbi:Metal-dependent hydrolase of the beta-lactamase superfamily I [Fructilactobacillus florum 8D]|uniref:Metal-dependent hydrolase of the beta-lactamase superfamily I n=1 Tax=Fructilactobacillus florum 8D TaxID=1221538 RepID=W9EJU7_9LACO|nr:MBL fold metallo-hydrolase [Fructilactobacillus florum]EKK20337.1 Metal-dependent hydrolase of the beta-lactamase superfamily I [Fructilactobacillus florum 2F]ETO39949.1 Metal-dependent hydrolase of the beta-lactamase superfamily I [Fructilactobacillus florum 8D]
MRVTILGFYGGYPFAGIGTSSYLIETGTYRLLLDCGSGALLELEKHCDPLQLDAVLLSHYHADHIADLGVLQYYWQLHDRRPRRSILPIYGHQLDQAHFQELTWPHATQRQAYLPTQVNELGPFELSFLRTVHPVPAFAIRIVERATGHALMYTADSAFFPGLTKLAQRADLVIADTNFAANDQRKHWHLTSVEAGRLARQAHVSRLLLSHLPQTIPPEQLRQEAQAEAGTNVTVLLPSQGQSLEI